MSGESLRAVADWMRTVVDATWMVYTVLAVAVIVVLVIAVIAEIVHR